MRSRIPVKIISFLSLVLVIATAYGLSIGPGTCWGGVNYKTTLRNPTPYPVRVVLLVDKLVVKEERERATIQPNGSYTWETGALCPVYFEGEIMNPATEEYVDMQRWSLLYNYHTTSSGEFPLCGSSSWSVCRKRGKDTVNDGDFGFCKQ